MTASNEALFRFFFSFTHRSPWIDSLGVFFATNFVWVLLALAIVLVWRERRRYVRIVMVAEALLAIALARGILTELVRFFYATTRPFVTFAILPLVVHDAVASFPSGHAAILFALATALWYARRSWGALFFLGAILNGIARVFVGIHWPVDIVGGAVVGIVSGIAIHAVIPHLRRKPFLRILGPEQGV